jgi:hypothetical protein
MSIVIVLVWQLTAVFLSVVAVVALLRSGWCDVIAAKVAFTCNKLIDALLELEDK